MPQLFNQSAIRSIYVGQTGHSHSQTPPPKGEPPQPFTVDCAICEPYLVREGWVYRRDAAPLSDAEQREKERIEREGGLATKQMAEALSETAAELAGAKFAEKARTRSARTRI